MSDEPTAPPWSLTGNGYIFLYRFPRTFAEKHTRLGQYQGGFGVVMLVDYQTSNVGPYGELLFIPGVVNYPQGRGYSISRIYVSTQASVDKGIENWAIPKQLASFNYEQDHVNDACTVKSVDTDEVIFEANLQSDGLRFPVSGIFLPRLYQHRDGKTYITRLKARGTGQLARIESIKVNENFFPNISQFKPLIAIKVRDFSMQFPVPVIK